MNRLAQTYSYGNNHISVTPDHTYGSFLKQARIINKEHHTAFTYQDFPHLSHTNFRRIIHKLGDTIERVGKGCPQYYKVRGIKLPGDTHRITPDRMRVQQQDFIKLLESLSDQPPKIHDIKIKVTNSELHEMMKNKGYSIDPTNHSIKVNYDSIDNNVTTKILVYPNTIQIDIGCTYNPLVNNTETMWFLHEHLSNISYHLRGLSGAFLPRVIEWTITHWHFGKDGTESYDGQNFHYTIEDVNNGLIRFYSKKMLDGKTIVRLEQAQSPQCSIQEKMEELIQN